jgi:hypothetical protein
MMQRVFDSRVLIVAPPAMAGNLTVTKAQIELTRGNKETEFARNN